MFLAAAEKQDPSVSVEVLHYRERQAETLITCAGKPAYSLYPRDIYNYTRAPYPSTCKGDRAASRSVVPVSPGDRVPHGRENCPLLQTLPGAGVGEGHLAKEVPIERERQTINVTHYGKFYIF